MIPYGSGSFLFCINGLNKERIHGNPGGERCMAQDRLANHEKWKHMKSLILKPSAY